MATNAFANAQQVWRHLLDQPGGRNNGAKRAVDRLLSLFLSLSCSVPTRLVASNFHPKLRTPRKPRRYTRKTAFLRFFANGSVTNSLFLFVIVVGCFCQRVSTGTLLEEIGGTLAGLVEDARAQAATDDAAHRAQAHAAAQRRAAWRAPGGWRRVLAAPFWPTRWGDDDDEAGGGSGADAGGIDGGESASGGGLLGSALEHLQAAGVAFLNAQQPHAAARVLTLALSLAQAHDPGGDVATAAIPVGSGASPADVTTADHQCQLRYWLGRTQVDLAGAAAAAAGGDSSGLPRSAKVAALKRALALALAHLDVAADPTRCHPARVAAPAAAVRAQVRELARGYS